MFGGLSHQHGHKLVFLKIPLTQPIRPDKLSCLVYSAGNVQDPKGLTKTFAAGIICLKPH